MAAVFSLSHQLTRAGQACSDSDEEIDTSSGTDKDRVPKGAAIKSAVVVAGEASESDDEDYVDGAVTRNAIKLDDSDHQSPPSPSPASAARPPTRRPNVN